MAALAAALGVDVFSGWAAFLSVVLALSFGVAVAGLFGAFATVGDFAGLDAVLVIIIGTVLVAALEGPPAAVIDDSLVTAFPLPFPPLVPFVVSPSPPLRSVELLLLAAGLLAVALGATFARVSSTLGLAAGVDFGASALAAAGFAAGALVLWPAGSERGCSWMALCLKLACTGVFSAGVDGSSTMEGGDMPSSSPLVFLVDTLMFESRLGSLCNPIRPSFSIAMKLVWTLERGLGDSVPSTQASHISSLRRKKIEGIGHG